MQAIVCVSKNWGIGRDGSLLFHLSGDLKRFRELTLGKTIVYGIRTLATFPNQQPLPDRNNVVLTHRLTPIPGALLAHTGAEAVALAGDDAFVVGGASVYTQMLPYCKRVLVTKVDAEVKADSYFINLDAHPDWRVEREGETMEENGLRFRYVDYARVQPWPA